ncbi:MAG: 4-(cytidine 5'-diphospho)-2-C-methyl-D-erythritol kinase, partial [Eggerthellaceae bacterium]|nr:4-(cytidine 5'-diphospho)-2-C-methyl-D-erythritol kinase [Eggerthellaceae bacterium]
MTLFNNGDQPVDMMEIARQTTARDVERRKPGTVKVVAPAKVNLVLKVGERREDGYHPLENVFQAVMLHDLVYLWPEGPVGAVTCECVAFEGLPPVDAAPENNLATRAVRALARALFGAPDGAPGIGIRIEKHIPAQAGLGGGSSDAAAALVGAARVWTDAGALAEDAITPELLEKVAAPLGADVTFFLRGGAALYDGVGEHFVRAYAPRKD